MRTGIDAESRVSVRRSASCGRRAARASRLDTFPRAARGSRSQLATGDGACEPDSASESVATPCSARRKVSCRHKTARRRLFTRTCATSPAGVREVIRDHAQRKLGHDRGSGLALQQEGEGFAHQVLEAALGEFTARRRGPRHGDAVARLAVASRSCTANSSGPADVTARSGMAGVAHHGFVNRRPSMA